MLWVLISAWLVLPSWGGAISNLDQGISSSFPSSAGLDNLDQDCKSDRGNQTPGVAKHKEVKHVVTISALKV